MKPTGDQLVAGVCHPSVADHHTIFVREQMNPLNVRRLGRPLLRDFPDRWMPVQGRRTDHRRQVPVVGAVHHIKSKHRLIQSPDGPDPGAPTPPVADQAVDPSTRRPGYPTRRPGYPTGFPYISPSGSLMSSIRAPSGSLKYIDEWSMTT